MTCQWDTCLSFLLCLYLILIIVLHSVVVHSIFSNSTHFLPSFYLRPNDFRFTFASATFEVALHQNLLSKRCVNWSCVGSMWVKTIFSRILSFQRIWLWMGVFHGEEPERKAMSSSTWSLSLALVSAMSFWMLQRTQVEFSSCSCCLVWFYFKNWKFIHYPF